MIWDVLIPLLAIGPVLFGAWQGWSGGATFSFRHLIAHLFAMLSAIAFWQPVNASFGNTLAYDPRILAALSFACLYLVAFALAAFAVALRAPVFRSVDTNPLDQILGSAGGALAGSFLGGSLVLIAALVMPPGQALPESGHIASAWPKQVFRLAETAAGIEPASPAIIRFPEVTFQEQRPDADAVPDENGMVRVRVVPEIVWK